MNCSIKLPLKNEIWLISKSGFVPDYCTKEKDGLFEGFFCIAYSRILMLLA